MKSNNPGHKHKKIFHSQDKAQNLKILVTTALQHPLLLNTHHIDNSYYDSPCLQIKYNADILQGWDNILTSSQTLIILRLLLTWGAHSEL